MFGFRASHRCTGCGLLYDHPAGTCKVCHMLLEKFVRKSETITGGSSGATIGTAEAMGLGSPIPPEMVRGEPMETIRERYEDEYIQHQGLGRDGTPLLVPEMLTDIGKLLGLINELRLDLENRLNETHHPTYQAVVIREYPLLKRVRELVG